MCVGRSIFDAKDGAGLQPGDPATARPFDSKDGAQDARARAQHAPRARARCKVRVCGCARCVRARPEGPCIGIAAAFEKGL